MLLFLAQFGRSPWYWLLLIVSGIALEGAALGYQYLLDYGPCVVCIHVRIWVAAAVVVALMGLWARKFKTGLLLTHLLSSICFIGLLERSWKTFAVERRWSDGACTMDVGLPSWFALDDWFPFLFEAWEPCGYTPELLFGITMAEGLLAIAGAGLLLSLAMIVATISKAYK